MENLQLKGNWNILKGKLKQAYSNLTDDDLTYVEGKEDELLGRLQRKTGQSADQLNKWIRENGDQGTKGNKYS